MNRHRLAVIVGALVLAAIVGGIAYNVGLTQGIEQSGKVITAPGGPNVGPYPYPYPYPYYGWHRPWGFGFFFFPFFFLAFWFLIIRGIFWRGGWHRRGCGVRDDFDDAHRRAHERMSNVSV